MMSTLAQHEDATKVLLVIDVQNCLFQGPNALPDAQALTEKISDILARARRTNGRVKSKLISVKVPMYPCSTLSYFYNCTKKPYLKLWHSNTCPP